jgi:hypothetical protein
MFKIGDLVTRNKYNNDCLFKIKDIRDGIYYLSGVDIRLYVSTTESDLRKESERINYEDDIYINNERKEDYYGDKYINMNSREFKEYGRSINGNEDKYFNFDDIKGIKNIECPLHGRISFVIHENPLGYN